MLWRGLSLAVLVGSVNAGCNAYRPEPEMLPTELSEPVQIQGTPLTRIWTRHVVRSPSSPLAIDNMSLFVGGSDHKVAAVDLATGRNRWVIRLSGPITAGLLRSGGLLYAVTDQPEGRLHAITPTAGNEAWSEGTGFVDVPLVIIGDQLYAINRVGMLTSFNPISGKRLWRQHLERARIPPVAADSSHILVTTPDSLFVLSRETGNVVTRLRAPGTIVTPWLERGDELLAATADSTVLAMDRQSFKLLWSEKVDAPVLSDPVLRGDTLFVVTRIGTVYRRLLDGGGELERLTALSWPVTADPILAGAWLIIGGADGDLRALSPDGSQAWQLHMGRPIEVAPVFEDSTLFGVGGTGQISRFQL